MIAGKLDAVLPLTIKDYERFRILNYSIKRFLECLNTLWIVTKNDEYKELSAKLTETNYHVFPEEEIIPELRFYNPIMRPVVSVRLRKSSQLGWYVQQLIKMAIATTIETDFYLTLDADVICLKPVRYSDLVHNGRAVTNTTNEDWHPDWYRCAERVLGLRRSGITHGVTPAVLSKKAMIHLHDYLQAKSNILFKIVSRTVIRDSRSEHLLRSWRSYLLRNIPWTEYSLYNTYLEATELFDEFHFRGGPYAIYDTYNSVWDKHNACDWDPGRLNKDSFFAVVESFSGLTPEYVMKRVESL
jgi:hypothetical protein